MCCPLVVPVDTRKAYVFYKEPDENYISGSLCTHSAAGSVEEITTSADDYLYFSATSQGNDIHPTFLNSSNYMIHMNYTYGSGWGAAKPFKRLP